MDRFEFTEMKDDLPEFTLAEVNSIHFLFFPRESALNFAPLRGLALKSLSFRLWNTLQVVNTCIFLEENNKGNENDTLNLLVYVEGKNGKMFLLVTTTAKAGLA